MKDKKKLINKIFKMILIISFAIFITIFISNEYGYYEYKKHEQVTLTQEQIKKFEQDIKDGKNVELNNYITNQNKNYQTSFSKLGLNISNSISGVVKKSVDSLFSKLGKMISS